MLLWLLYATCVLFNKLVWKWRVLDARISVLIANDWEWLLVNLN
jgi:hypothetical protein